MEAREKKRCSPVPAQREIGDGGRGPGYRGSQGRWGLHQNFGFREGLLDAEILRPKPGS